MPTEKEIIDACEHLKTCMLQAIEAERAETNAKLERIRTHNELRMARDVIHGLRFS